MTFHFRSTIYTKSILWFSLNHFIYKVSCFNWPSSWNFTLFNLNLSRKNMVSYFFSWFSYIRSSSIHAFISNDADSKVINCSSMILSAHDFWCHIPRCTWSILSVFWSPYSCNTKISYTNITIIINDKILRFNISMNNLFFMTVFKTSN